MRISVTSDVHGNQRALNADLADLPARDVDLTVNLADILSGVLQPKETADRLIPLDLPTVRGNHERQVLTDSPDKMGLADRLARDAMTAEHSDGFEALPPPLEISKDVLAFHGSPPMTSPTCSRRLTQMGCGPRPRE
ncbi:metallophosphoesterase [Arthrobacter sp. UYEF20]|uniref:metallophosphoesterase family protein n=1 Tax=Arthrobacter sp. UYEF20 TaxID=1756363 RepID=UPI0033918A45